MRITTAVNPLPNPFRVKKVFGPHSTNAILRSTKATELESN